MLGWLFGRKKDAPQGNAELLVLDRKVPVPVERAFAVFVDEIGTWWPRDATWAGNRLEGMAIEPRYGGRCIERSPEGERVWGTVLAAARPEQIVFTWQIAPDRTPIDSPEQASRVDVRFAASGPAEATVVLVHRDFPRHDGDWRAYRAAMAGKQGWPRLLDLYAAACRSG